MSNAKLNQLSVMGIRSFDNQFAEVIKFGTPLTLIVGLNGSGKTTIIECLKYLTTGDLPPNSKGGAFIHDPKLCGEKEVLATCKLSYMNTQDKKMICSRRLQLTVMKKTRSQKTLEGALVMYSNGERTAISSRVAELDQMVPMYLGVSKSILDNVIFCHQDESLWPMSEPSVLKKKFDEIFEALKYTKAIDNIKILKKKYDVDLGQLKIRAGNAKQEKTNGEKNEKQQEQLDREMDVLRKRSHELAKDISEAERKHTEATDRAASFHEIVSALNGKRIEAKAKEDNLEDLEEHTDIMSQSDEQLRSMLETHQGRVEQFQGDLENKKQHYRDIEGELADSRKRVEHKHQEKGRLTAATDAYNSQLQRREQMVKELARDHNIRGYDDDLNDDQVKDFMDRIAKMAKDQRSALEQAQKQSREENGKIQQTLHSHNNRKDALSKDMQTTKQSIAENDGKVKRLREKAGAIVVDEGRQAVLQSNVEDIEAQLEGAKRKWQQGDREGQIAEVQSTIQSHDRAVEQLQSELHKASKQDEELARSNLLKKDVKTARLELEKLQGARDEPLRKVLESSWDPSNVYERFTKAQNDRANALHDVQKEHDATDRECSNVAFKLKSARQELKQKKAEREKLQKRIEQDTKPEEDASGFPKLLEQAEADYEVANTDDLSWIAMKEYYENCLAYLDKHKACKLCDRTFGEKDNDDAMRNNIAKNLGKAKAALGEKVKEEAGEVLNKLREVQPAYDRWLSLRDDEVPRAQRAVDELEPRHEELSRSLDNQHIKVQKHESEKTELDSWADDVRKLSDLHSNIARYESELQSLTQRKSQGSVLKSTDELLNQIREENDQRRTADMKLSRLRTEREEAQSNITRLELSLRDERSTLNSVIQQLKDKSAVREQMEDVNRHTESLRKSTSTINSELTKLNPEIEKTQLQLDDASRRGEKKVSQLQDGMTNLSTTLNRLESAEQEIRAYVSNNTPSQLQSCERALESLYSNMKRLEKERGSLTSNINKLEKEQHQHDQTQQQINQNIRYRSYMRSFEDTRRQIQELESHNAEADRQEWQKKAAWWQNKASHLTSDNARIVGEMTSKDQELKRLGDDWETLYNGAGYRYREAIIKVEATKAAVQDLANYANALDKAIMTYHALKMDEINEIIDDLWRRTYQGTDVDTVLIRSDAEGVQRGANKSYNYRVCMVKQDAEMDMRGRCSAGQKVLASIIIRLALAECFGANCGVMALDEPTTNLDRDNIRALASSLNSIIKSRADTQKNFQLIVITHDEEFLKDMRAQDFCDDYWRVSRNERQKSKIEKQTISTVW